MSIGFSSPKQPDIPVTLLLGVHLSAIPDPACAQHACVTVAQTSEKSAKLIAKSCNKAQGAEPCKIGEVKLQR